MRHDPTKEIAEAVREATAPLHAEIAMKDARIDAIRIALAEEREARSIAETALTDYTRCRTASPNPIASAVGASDDDGELVAVDFFDATGLVLGGVDVTAGKVVWSVAGGESGSMENPAMRCRTAADVQRVREDRYVNGVIERSRAHHERWLTDPQCRASVPLSDAQRVRERTADKWTRKPSAAGVCATYLCMSNAAWSLEAGGVSSEYCHGCKAKIDAQELREAQQRRALGERCVLCGRTDGQCWHGDDDWPGRDGGIDA